MWLCWCHPYAWAGPSRNDLRQLMAVGLSSDQLKLVETCRENWSKLVFFDVFSHFFLEMVFVPPIWSCLVLCCDSITSDVHRCDWAAESFRSVRLSPSISLLPGEKRGGMRQTPLSSSKDGCFFPEIEKTCCHTIWHATSRVPAWIPPNSWGKRPNHNVLLNSCFLCTKNIKSWSSLHLISAGFKHLKVRWWFYSSTLRWRFFCWDFQCWPLAGLVPETWRLIDLECVAECVDLWVSRCFKHRFVASRFVTLFFVDVQPQDWEDFLFSCKCWSFGLRSSTFFLCPIKDGEQAKCPLFITFPDIDQSDGRYCWAQLAGDLCLLVHALWYCSLTRPEATNRRAKQNQIREGAFIFDEEWLHTVGDIFSCSIVHSIWDVPGRCILNFLV